MQKSLSQQAKALANKAGVKTRIRTSGNVYVTFLSEPSNELVEAIKALSTLQGHGDLQNDTRYYTGQGIQVSFDYEIPKATMIQFGAIMAKYAELGYHFKQAVLKEMGYKGQACLDKGGF